MTDRARELLDEALSYTNCESWSPSLTEEIRAYLADTNPSETINSQEVDRSKPVAWMLISTVGSRHYHMSEQQALKGLQMYGGKVIALYDHPVPRKPFVRLSEEEMKACEPQLGIVKTPDGAKVDGLWIYDFARAIEDALEEKNSG